MAKALGRELGRNIPESSVARWESGHKLAGADVYLAYETIAKSASQGTRDSMDERMTRVERALSLLPLDLAGDDLLTVAQAAKLAKVSRQTIHNWVKAARVRYVTQGRRLLISRADVLAAVVAD